MNNRKCMTCGLVNSPSTTVCKRCGSAVTDSTSTSSFQSGAGSSSGLNPNGFVGAQLRATTRNLLVVNVCVGAALLIAFAVCGRYFYNFFLGPFPMTSEQIASLRSDDNLSRYFVKVPIENAMDYSVQEVKEGRRSSREEVVAEYYALVFGEKLLLVKASANYSDPDFIGSVETMSSTESREVIARFIQNDPGARGAFLPVMLDATGFRGPGYIGLAAGIPLLLLSIWNVKKALARKSNPDRHPLLAALAKYGSPQTVASRIDSEVAAAGAKPSGPVVITASWLLSPSTFTLNVRSLADLVWVYKKVTKRSVNFIPTGKSYATIIWDRHGKSLEISNRKEQDSHRLLEDIGRCAPWVLIGYGDDLASAWKSDAASVIGAVDQRRSQLNEPQPSSQEA